MADQAELLRLKIRQHQGMSVAKTVAVISGKGGVGKTNFSLNFSILLSKLGKRVLLFDMDIGMGNIDILLGNGSERTIVDFFQKGYSLKEVITAGPAGLSYISGGTGLTNLFSMNSRQFERFTNEFANIQREYDYVIFDLGAGISQESNKFLMCVDEIITITTPEPTAIMDAYSIIKFLHFQCEDTPIFLVCNKTEREKQGNEAINKIQSTLQRFIGKEIIPLGLLPDNKIVSKAVIRHTPFYILNPDADISLALYQLTANYLTHAYEEVQPVLMKQSFISKLKNYFIGR